MKLIHLHMRLFSAMLFCVLCVVSASEDDLMDFDFTDLKEIDWSYDNEKATDEMSTVADIKKYQDNLLTFEDYLDVDNQVNPFDWRERLLRTALSKALTNAALRQQFVEVMPILRVLSSQQRLALSALISAQINARHGQELKLDQVRMMFGDDRKLLIPIVYDIANMVRNSARKYLTLDIEAQSFSQTPLQNRKLELTSAELAAEDQERQQEQQQKQYVGVIDTRLEPVAHAYANEDTELIDFFGEMPDDVLDAKHINEELQTGNVAAASRHANTKSKMAKPVDRPVRRSRRDVAGTDFVHKLIRSVPLSVNEDELLRGVAGRTVKLNTTSFAAAKDTGQQVESSTTTTIKASTGFTVSGAKQPTVGHDTTAPPPYQEIEDLAFANLNGTEVQLDHLNKEPVEHREMDEPLPNPAELIAGPRYRVGGSGGNGNKGRQTRPKGAVKRNRVQGGRPYSKQTAASASRKVVVPSPKNCERFTASMCIHTDDYPFDQIMGSIRRHKNAMSALLAEYYDQPISNNWDVNEEFEDYPYNKKRREGENSGAGGGMCQSVVRYARPQKARSAAGEWKYIVNTGQHTQTLRLEKCLNPQDSCSYLAQNYRSHCAQVYNFHRLLSWDKSRGLHVDIFKVPTCCSCQVDGYRQQFPPLGAIKAKDYTPAHDADIYSTINEELDYNDDEDDDDLNYQLHSAYDRRHHKDIYGGGGGGGYDDNELLAGTKQVRTKAYLPNPTVGSYLSPPAGSETYDKKNYAYKGGRGGGLTRRRPNKSFNVLGPSNEARVDLEIAQTELHSDEEVNLFGTPHARLPQKRKHIYSVPHTATSTVGSGSAYSSAGTTASTGVHGGAGHAAHANQASAASPPYYSFSANSILAGSGSGGSVKPKPRFRSTLASATANVLASATPSSTVGSIQHRHHHYHHFQPQSQTEQASAPPSLHQVNSIFGTRHNNNNTNNVSNNGAVATAKRINYNYHPIIDFFESNKRAAHRDFTPTTPAISSAVSNTPTTSPSTTRQHIFPHKIPKSNSHGSGLYQTRERRIGVVVAADADAVGAGGADGGVVTVEDNAWHPVVVQP